MELRVQWERTKGCCLLHHPGARSNLKAIFDFHCSNVSKCYIVHKLNWPYSGSCQQSSNVLHPFSASTTQAIVETKLFSPGVFAVVEAEAMKQITAKTTRCLL